MGVKPATYFCDECGRDLEWKFVEITQTVIKQRDYIDAIHQVPEIRKVFCNHTCLLKHYDFISRYCQET